MLTRLSLTLAAVFVSVCTTGNAAALAIDRVALVQPILLTSNGVPALAPYAAFEAGLDKIWAQAGIAVSFLPAVTHEDPANMVLDLEELVATEPGREPTFFAGFHGQSPDPLAVDMWFVNSITSHFSSGDILGVTNAILDRFGQPAYVNEIVMSAATFPEHAYAMAHELGHVFGLGHIDATYESCAGGDASNLMAACTGIGFSGSMDDIAPDGQAFFELTSAQVSAVRLSPFAQPLPAVPLPPALILFTGGLVGILLSHRQRTAKAAPRR
jgi:hypothetical protein